MTEDQMDALAAFEKTNAIYGAGLHNGVWGKTDSAPYPIGTEGHTHWKAGFAEGAAHRFKVMGFWGPDRRRRNPK